MELAEKREARKRDEAKRKTLMGMGGDPLQAPKQAKAAQGAPQKGEKGKQARKGADTSSSGQGQAPPNGAAADGPEATDAAALAAASGASKAVTFADDKAGEGSSLLPGGADGADAGDGGAS